MKKMLRFILLILVVLGIAAGVGMWKVRQLAGSQILIETETIFTLKPGTGRLALGEQLYNEKIINRPRVFQWLLRVQPELSHFKAGTYRFTPGMTVKELLQLLESGKEAQFPLRFVEGMRLSDYLKQLREAPYIKHTLQDDSYATVAQVLKFEHPEWVEGWFWPDTWMYTAGTTDVALLQRAHKKWSLRWIKPGKGGWKICRIKIRTSSSPWPLSSRKRRQSRVNGIRLPRYLSIVCVSECVCKPIRR